MGAAPHATVSGGTPALRLNSTHFLAVGHTMTWTCNTADVRAKGKAARARCMARHRWRAYAMFAYTFDARPPFQLRSVSREFRLRLPDGQQQQPRAQGGGGRGFAQAGMKDAAGMADVDASFLWPPPTVRAIHLKLRGIEGKPQFPVGLSWAPPSMPPSRGVGGLVGGQEERAGPSSAAAASAAASAVARARPSCVLLSWGHDDAETYVSTIPLDTILAPRMTTVLA